MFDVDVRPPSPWLIGTEDSLGMVLHTTTQSHQFNGCNKVAVCSLLAGKSGVEEISRFDASEFPTRFAAQIKDFDPEGCVFWHALLATAVKLSTCNVSDHHLHGVCCQRCSHKLDCQRPYVALIHVSVFRLIDKKNVRRYDDCLKYTMVGSKKALADAGLSREDNPEAFEKLDKTRVGVLVGSGMGGLQVFQDGVTNLVQKVRLHSSARLPSLKDRRSQKCA